MNDSKMQETVAAFRKAAEATQAAAEDAHRKIRAFNAALAAYDERIGLRRGVEWTAR